MTSDGSFKAAAARRLPHRATLNRALRQVMKNFSAFDASVMQDGALSFKHKELIAVAVAVALRCDDCIGFHVEQAVRAGASDEEIMEALSVAILLSGGPGVMYATHASAALSEYRGETEKSK